MGSSHYAVQVAKSRELFARNNSVEQLSNRIAPATPHQRDRPETAPSCEFAFGAAWNDNAFTNLSHTRGFIAWCSLVERFCEEDYQQRATKRFMLGVPPDDRIFESFCEARDKAHIIRPSEADQPQCEIGNAVTNPGDPACRR